MNPCVKTLKERIIIEVSQSPLPLTSRIGKQFHDFLVEPSNVSFSKNKHKCVLFLLHSHAKYTQN